MRLLQLCFAPGSIDGSRFASLLRGGDLGFQPEQVSGSHLTHRQPFGEDAICDLERAVHLRHARVANNSDEYFALGGIAGRAVQQIRWHGVGHPPGELIESLVALPSFNAGHCGDADDIIWQSETSIASYRTFSKPYEHLRRIPGGIFPGEWEEIDVSDNPGRRTAVEGFWLCAASTMWFGPGALGVIDRSRVESTPVGEVHRLGPDLMRVDLFPMEWYEDSHLEDIRVRQAEFRDWMRYDELEVSLAGKR